MALTIDNKRIRETALRNGKGEFDLNQCFNHEIYPAIRRLEGSVIEINNILNRFVPRFVTGASNAILSTDEQALICVDHASATTLTLDSTTAFGFAAGASIAMIQYGAGQLTFSGTGLTIRTAETQRTRKQYSSLFITKLRDDEWFLTGDMELF